MFRKNKSSQSSHFRLFFGYDFERILISWNKVSQNIGENTKTRKFLPAIPPKWMRESVTRNHTGTGHQNSGCLESESGSDQLVRC